MWLCTPVLSAPQEAEVWETSSGVCGQPGQHSESQIFKTGLGSLFSGESTSLRASELEFHLQAPVVVFVWFCFFLRRVWWRGLEILALEGEAKVVLGTQ